MPFQEEYAKLNDEQKIAVEAIEGPVMVLAGPGTGKTQVIAMRIANILRKAQVNPYNILCLTFTNSGVKAMRERLVKIVGLDGYKVAIHTFHSFCNEVIGLNPGRFLFAKNIVQIKDWERREFIKQSVDQAGLKLLRPINSPYYYLEAILKSISDLKREGFSPEKFGKTVAREKEDFAGHPEYFHQKGRYKGKLIGKYADLKKTIEKNEELVRVYDFYQKKLDENGKYDYDDMVLLVLKEFREDKDFLADFQERYLYILVDEYQDTNGAQNEIIELLGSFDHDPNIFVVGDDDQAIYRFQGANLENLIYFADLFPKTKKIVLKKNYRSESNVILGARSMMKDSSVGLQNNLGIVKEIESTIVGDSGKIELCEFENDYDELYFVIEKIKELKKNGINLSEIAIFFRNNSEADELTWMLAKNGINYHLEKGENIFSATEIIWLKNLMQFIDNVQDDELLFRVVQFDFWKTNALDVYKVIREAKKYTKQGLSVFDWLVDNLDGKLTETVSDVDVWRNIVTTIVDLRKSVNNVSFSEWLEKVMRDTGLLDWVLDCPDRLKGMARLKKFYKFFQEINKSDKELDLKSAITILQQITEDRVSLNMQNQDYQGEGVNLMTAHKSKGLEYEYVFIYRCLDKVWSNKTNRQILALVPGILKKTTVVEDDDEDRRLFYVALTRAKKKIFVCWAKKYEGRDEGKEKMPAMFVQELGDEFIEKKQFVGQEKIRDDFLKMYFAQKEVDDKNQMVSEDEKKYLKKLVEEFKLSPTGLNKYLECPRKFMYDNLIKVPKAKSANLSFGTAVHYALENFYTEYKKTGHLPEKDELLNYYQNGLKHEILTKNDFELWLEKGKKVLSVYFDIYHDDFRIPLYTEYNFGLRNVLLDGVVPLTGKVDRIELMPGSKNEVMVVDYKTGKPKSQNEIEGKTANADGSYLRQLVFYKILGELAGNFVYNIKETEIDFVGDGENNRPRKIKLAVTLEMIDDLKKVIKDVWQKINNLEFGCTGDDNKACSGGYGGKKCEYWEVCGKWKISNF